MSLDRHLSDSRDHALAFEQQINLTVLGLGAAVRHIVIAVYARGHVLLEGAVGVGICDVEGAVAARLRGQLRRRGCGRRGHLRRRVFGRRGHLRR